MTNTEEFPQPDTRDKLHKLVTSLVSPIPYASELIEAIIKAPIEKRRDDWFRSLPANLEALMKVFDDLTPEKLAENEVFITTVLEATQIAIRTHQKVKLEALQNSVLNAALPDAPDEIQQKMFLQLLDELTPWHVKILTLFRRSNILRGSLDLDDKNWMMNMGLSELGEIIESTFPEMGQQSKTYIPIIKELHSKGLIANKFPAKGRMTRIAHSPELTPLARDFLKFIESPLDE